MSDTLDIYVLGPECKQSNVTESLLPSSIEVINRREYATDDGEVHSIGLDFWYKDIDLTIHRPIKSTENSVQVVPDHQYILSLSVERLYFHDITIAASDSHTGESISIDPIRSFTLLSDILDGLLTELEIDRIIGDSSYVLNNFSVVDGRRLDHWYWLNILSDSVFDDYLNRLPADTVWQQYRVDDYQWIVLSSDPTASRENEQIGDRVSSLIESSDID